MLFPIELVSIIVDELRGDRLSLLSLGQTSSAIYRLTAPLIYENVHLATTKSVECFCRTVNRDTCDFSSYTQTLALIYDITFTKDLANNFRTALQSMPNLQELFLDIHFEDVDRCFEGLDAPFKLRKLRIPVLSSPAFKSFISSQPSITELQFKYTPSWDTEAMEEIFAQSDVLPNLNRISAGLGILYTVVPGRPVTDIMTLGEWNGDEWTDIAECIWRIYSSSAVPVTTTGFYSWHGSGDPWRVFIPTLGYAARNLKRFRIIEVFRDFHGDEDMYCALTGRTMELVTLGGFEQLEAIEVVLHHENKPSKSQVLKWLGGMSFIAAWKEFIPSLQQVAVYGIDLE